METFKFAEKLDENFLGETFTAKKNHNRGRVFYLSHIIYVQE